jgi:hypothetical protein
VLVPLRAHIGRPAVYRRGVVAGVLVAIVGCQPSSPPAKVGLLQGMTSRDGRLGSTCQNWKVINAAHNGFNWQPVCWLPYVRLVANADDYHGATVAVSGYVLRTSSGLELVPSPEYLRRDLIGESISLRGGVPNDQTLTELMSRPRNDLCGPVWVSGKFDRTAMGRESAGFILGEIMMTGPVGGPIVFTGKHAVDEMTCKSVAAPAPAESQQRPKS